MRKGGLAGDPQGRADRAAAAQRAGGDRRPARGSRERHRPRPRPPPTSPAPRPRRDLRDRSLYVNRELSWLDFNDRVLQLAEDDSLPLIERLKFLAIFVTNLDEFFMIRVAGVHDQVDARIDARGPDGLAPTEVLEGIAEHVGELDRRHARAVLGGDPARPGASRASGSSSCEDSGRRPQEHRAPLPRADLPGADAARGRSRPAVPLHLQPLAEPDRAPPRPRPRPRGVRPRQGAQGGAAAVRRDRARTRSSRSRTSSPSTSTRCSRGWTSSATTCSASRATPTSRSPTRPTTCCRPSRTSCAAGASARSFGSRSAPAWIRRCGRG